mgnify:CR=1 FL=1
MNRFFELFLIILMGFILLIPAIFIAILIKVDSRGPILYRSKRIGKGNDIFFMPKFRTMSIDAPEVATHLLENPSNYYTPIGKFIRKFSIDEFPQLYSIIRGDMSLVGPRPALFNQEDLISLRTEEGVHDLIPGITGLAQVSGRDELSIVDKVRIDKNYLEQRSFKFDLYIIWLTVLKVLKRDGISH